MTDGLKSHRQRRECAVRFGNMLSRVIGYISSSEEMMEAPVDSDGGEAHGVWHQWMDD